MALTLLLMGCSTSKNTSQSRWWHSFNAKYNTYYNGSVSYIDASLEKENGNKDNYTEMIPLYAVGNKQSIDLGKANYDRAITKCEKAIHQHSIKRRPVWDKKRRKTAADIEWLSRREYNPFLWKAWLLMGRSQFHKGAFDDAAATFAYMSRLYATQPAIYGKARAWLAKCYIEQDWMYDAEDVIRNMRRDSMDWRAVKEWDYTYTDYYLHTGELDKAIPYLRKVIKHEMRRKQKAREWFLMGQLQAAIGNRTEAYKAFKKVTSQNPPYELDFNARIAMTEVMAKGQSKKTISRLKRMAASDKNKEYLDQVYYAIGNIYLAEKDTANAISAYEMGNTKATRNGIEKGVLLLHLGDLYWQKEKFGDARRCYGEAIGLLDKDRKDYEQLSLRSKVLDELVPYTDAVYMQDSLQALAKMNEKDRNAAIDRVIANLKKREKEQRDSLAEVESQKTQSNNGVANRNQPVRQPQQNNSNKGVWYFYNPLTVSQGKETFQRQWGKRENVDNWQRVNKTVVAGVGNAEEQELTDVQRDSIATEQAKLDSIEHLTDSAQNDPHKREYYLAKIPFTEEQMQASDAILQDGLFHSGVIFKDKLDNLILSEKALRRLTDKYPGYAHQDETYYHLFLLYSRQNQSAIADSYVKKLKDEWPKSQWTTILTDPYFMENAKLGKHIEDSLYASTYDAFKANRYSEVSGNVHVSETRFPNGDNRDKFIFIGGLNKLNNGDSDGCLTDMKKVVDKYPESQLSQMAGMIVNGVHSGRRLRGGKFDIGDIWQHRAVVLNDSDSIAAKQFSAERNTEFKYVIAYKPDSVNENQILFELAKYNFTSYLVRNFEINIVEADGIHQMQVSGFRNYDEALQYVRQLYKQNNVVKLLPKARSIIISDSNLEMLGIQFSYDDYDKFYNKHFAPLKISTYQLLTEPVDIHQERETEQESTQTDENKISEDGPIGNGGTDIEPATNTTIIAEPTKPVVQPSSGTTIIAEPTKPTEQSASGTTIIAEPTKPAGQPAGGTTIIAEPTKPEEQSASGTTIIAEPVQQVKQPATNTTIVTAPVKSVEQTISGTTIINEENVVPKKASDKPSVSGKTTITPPSALSNVVKPNPIKKQPVKPARQKDDTGIYFDDDMEQTEILTPKDDASSHKTEKSKEKDKFDLEDEYYDLEGF